MISPRPRVTECPEPNDSSGSQRLALARPAVHDCPSPPAEPARSLRSILSAGVAQAAPSPPYIALAIPEPRPFSGIHVVTQANATTWNSMMTIASLPNQQRAKLGRLCAALPSRSCDTALFRIASQLFTMRHQLSGCLGVNPWPRPGGMACPPGSLPSKGQLGWDCAHECLALFESNG